MVSEAHYISPNIGIAENYNLMATWDFPVFFLVLRIRRKLVFESAELLHGQSNHEMKSSFSLIFLAPHLINFSGACPDFFYMET